MVGTEEHLEALSEMPHVRQLRVSRVMGDAMAVLPRPAELEPTSGHRLSDPPKTTSAAGDFVSTPFERT